MYSSPNDNIAHIAVQPNDRFSNCVLLYYLSVFVDSNLTSLVKIFRSVLAKMLNQIQRCT